MSEAAMQQNWSQVAALAGDGQGLSPVERLLAGHAELALNRNNESLADFLTVTTLGELEQWSDWARGLREKNPGIAIAYYFEGDALARMHEWPAAIAAFTAGLKLAPGHALLLNARGVSYAATWDMTNAMVDLKAATLRNPRLADAFVSLGSMWVQQQRASSGAMQALDKALELSPNSAVARTLRSGVRMVQGDFPASQVDVAQAMKNAGQLTPAVQARLLDMASLVRGGSAKEVQQALASGANPGMLINRELQNLQQGQPLSLDKLMTIGQMFPDQRPAISSGIRDVTQANPSALPAVNAGLTRMSQADMLTKIAASTANLTLGPQIALQIGLSQDTRMTLASAPPPNPRVDLSGLSNNLSTAATVAGAVSHMLPERLTNLSFGLDAGSQGLNLVGAVVGGDAQQMREQLVSTNLWGLQQVASNLAKAAYPIGSDLHVGQSFAGNMAFLDPIQNLLSASTSQIGDGRWLPNQTEQTQYLSAAHSLLNEDFTRQFTPSTFADLSLSAKWGWGGALGGTAALPDLANFAASRFQNGWTSPMTVNQSISLFDSIAKGTAYTAAFMFSGGNASFASGASTLAGVAADQGRRWTMPFFSQFDFGTNAEMMTMYDNYAASQVAHHQSFTSYNDWLNPPAAAPRNPDQTITSSTTWHSSYTYSFNGAQANQDIQRALDPKPPDPVIPRPTFTPIQQQDFTNFIRSIQQSVGSGAGPAVAPGGFRTGMAMPYWEDGEWPITPWYGLGYVVNDRPSQGPHEERE
jgi:tetratricopeptide (TPR) repeat protein